MPAQKRIELVITGKVQGVGYRYSVKLKADSLGIRGYVMNQHDGSVFATAQGEISELNNFVKWCYRPSGSFHKRYQKDIWNSQRLP